MKVSIQGETASFSHIAAMNLYGSDIEILGRKTFKEVFEDLKNDRCDIAVLPIENSTYGSIFQNFDYLTKYGYFIEKEIYLKIDFHLIVNPNTEFNDISEIYSHPVAYEQVKTFLDNYPNIKVIEYPDTSGSVKYIKENNLVNSGAIAGRKASEMYNMKLLKESIQENKKNYTRFFGITKNVKTLFNKYDTKLTLQFVLGEEVGSLYNALKFFNERNIPLTKIESRPIINTHWNYRFYIDCLVNNGRIKNDLEVLKDYVSDLKILGSYVKGEYIPT